MTGRRRVQHERSGDAGAPRAPARLRQGFGEVSL